jgi:hypothetical protein
VCLYAREQNAVWDICLGTTYRTVVLCRFDDVNRVADFLSTLGKRYRAQGWTEMVVGGR